MSFPNLGELFAQFWPLAVAPMVLLGVSGYWIYRWRQPPEVRDLQSRPGHEHNGRGSRLDATRRYLQLHRPKLRIRRLPGWLYLFLAIWMLLFAATSAAVFAVFAANALQFRRVNPDDVTALAVERIPFDSSPGRQQPIRYRDKQQIRLALDKLARATHRDRNHESFTNGYRIQLLLGPSQEESELYLSVYRARQDGSPVAVVIAHVGPNAIDQVYTAGEYRCPDFLEWVTSNLDPLYANE